MRAWTSGLVVGGFLASAMVGCGGSATDGAVASGDQAQALQTSPEVARSLAELRRRLAPFHDFAKAEAAGWDTQITPCLENPPLGAMGFHYGKPSLIENGTVDLLQPELLLYEPEASGRLRFVGVEYIVPYTFVPRDGPAPVLLGQEFHHVDVFGVWGLHIWIERHNPSGMFADWNPKVSCAFAPSPSP